MKKGKKILCLFLAVTAVVALLAGGTAIWFFSDGIHTLGPFVHLEGEIECYRYDLDKGLTGDTGVLRLSGTGTVRDIPDNINNAGTFNGTFYLMGWPYDEGQLVSIDSENEKLSFTCATYQWPDMGSSNVAHRLIVDTSDGNFLYALLRRGEDTLYYVSSNDPDSAGKIVQKLLST